MKYFISILLLSLCSLSSAAEYGYFFVSSNSISDEVILSKGDTFEVLEVYPVNNEQRNGMNLLLDLGSDGAVDIERNLYYGLPDLIVGPCTITFRGRQSNSKNYLTYKITRAPNPQPAEAPAAAATTEN